MVDCKIFFIVLLFYSNEIKGQKIKKIKYKKMRSKKFATAINCMDGRVQLPIIEWLKKKYKVDFVDMITEPGPNKILAKGKDKLLIKSIKERTEISVKKHFSNLIALVGHTNCAGNPVKKRKQLEEIIKSVEIIKSWNLNAKTIGLWVNGKWEVERII